MRIAAFMMIFVGSFHCHQNFHLGAVQCHNSQDHNTAYNTNVFNQKLCWAIVSTFYDVGWTLMQTQYFTTTKTFKTFSLIGENKN